MCFLDSEYLSNLGDQRGPCLLVRVSKQMKVLVKNSELGLVVNQCKGALHFPEETVHDLLLQDVIPHLLSHQGYLQIKGTILPHF